MECLFASFGLAAVPAIGWVVGTWVFRPLIRAGRVRRLPPQYSIADFLCLFLLIQFPMALIHGYLDPGAIGFSGRDDGRTYVWVLDGYVWLACGALWWGSVRGLSRAGIRNPWSRIIFLVVVLPATLVATIVGCCLPFFLPFVLFEPRSSQNAWFFVGAVTVPAVVFCCGLYTRRIVAAAAPPGDAGASPFAPGPVTPSVSTGNPFRVESEQSEETENRRIS
jgi:hypothetical protein